MKIAEYLFDQPESAAGSIGGEVVNDSSGQGNNGVINTVRSGLTPARIVDGPKPDGYGFKSLEFKVDSMPTDHGGAIEPDDQLQFLKVPLTASLRNIDTTRAFTISFWAYHEVLDTSGNPWDGPLTLLGKELFCPQHVCGAEAFYVFVRTKNDTDNPASSVIPEERGELAFTGDGPKIVGAGGISDADTPQTDLGGTTTPGYHVPINAWVHIACVVQPPAGGFPGSWKMYVDGELKGSRDALPDLADLAQPIFPVDPRVDIRFGNFRGLNRPSPIAFGANDYAYNGYLTGIRIYDHDQTVGEICADISEDTGTPEVRVETPSIDFGLVAEGLTTVRPIRLSLRGCEGAVATASFVENDGAFDMPLGAVSSIPGLADLSARSEESIWVSYAAGAPGTVNAARVRVEVPDAGLDEIVEIAAESRARPSVSAALVLDRSWSMNGEAGIPGIRKVDLMREAARTLVDLMRDGDRIALVRYNHDAPPPHLTLRDVGPEGVGAGRNEARDYINSDELAPSGNTAIGDGIFEASALLASSTDEVQAMVVLTDGIETADRRIADVEDLLTAETYAIGFGAPSGINRDRLADLTSQSGGYLLVTGELDTTARFRLRKYFLQILSDVEDGEIVVDPQGVVTPRGAQAVPFSINEADVEADVVLLSENPKQVLLALEAPNGSVITPSNVTTFPNVRLIQATDVTYYRLLLPSFLDDPNGHRGEWKAWVGHAASSKLPGSDLAGPSAIGQAQDSTERYSVVVRARSSVSLKLDIAQASFEPGVPFEIRATLSQYDLPLDRGVTVRAIIERPDGTEVTLPLTNDGAIFWARYDDTLTPGAYQLRVVASGRSFAGDPIQRERSATTMVVRGGSETEDSTGKLTELLEETQSKLGRVFHCCVVLAVIAFLILLVLLW